MQFYNKSISIFDWKNELAAASVDLAAATSTATVPATDAATVPATDTETAAYKATAIRTLDKRFRARQTIGQFYQD